MGAFAAFGSPPSEAHARLGAAPGAQQSEALAIWPETDLSVVPATLPVWRTSARLAVTHFARKVLDYPAPHVNAKTGGPHYQPGDLGFYVRRTLTSHRIEVRVNRVIDDTHWSVDDVWGFGKHEHPATVDVTRHHAYVGFGYWGRANNARLILRYGDNHVRRTTNSGEATWSFPIDFPINVSGAVLVLFRDSAHHVYTGWGTPLPSGPFSAG